MSYIGNEAECLPKLKLCGYTLMASGFSLLFCKWRNLKLVTRRGATFLVSIPVSLFSSFPLKVCTNTLLRDFHEERIWVDVYTPFPQHPIPPSTMRLPSSSTSCQSPGLLQHQSTTRPGRGESGGDLFLRKVHILLVFFTLFFILFDCLRSFVPSSYQQ